MPRRDDAMLDGLLTRLESYRSELANGMTNHAPMVVEALVQLGRAEVADAWLDGYLEGALPPVVASAALIAYAWQSGCALHAAYAEQPLPIPAVPPLRPEALIDAAVNHGDEHVIKLTEVCLDFHSDLGDDVFLAVAARVCETIPRP